MSLYYEVYLIPEQVGREVQILVNGNGSVINLHFTESKVVLKPVSMGDFVSISTREAGASEWNLFTSFTANTSGYDAGIVKLVKCDDDLQLAPEPAVEIAPETKTDELPPLPVNIVDGEAAVTAISPNSTGILY